MSKPVLSSKTKTAVELLQYAENILAKVSEHVDLFPEALDTLVAIEAHVLTYRKSITDATYRDIRNIELRNQQGEQLKDLLYDFSLYVESVAQGDPALIMAAGFTISKKSSSYTRGAPKATDFRVGIPQLGLCTVHLRVKAWSRARFYQFEYRKVGSLGEWTRILNNRSRVAISDLEHLQEYEFRVTYLATDPTPNYSDVVRCYVV